MATSSQESANQEPAIQPKITTTAELVQLQTKALEKLAQIEDRLQVLEGRKRAYEAIDTSVDQSGSVTGRINRPPWATRDPLISSSHHSSSSHAHANRASTSREQESSSDSDSTPRHPKRARYSYARGIKITPSYTLTTGSSLREWGDWKRDIERVFEGDPQTYQSGSQKILKALDYLDPSLKSLWYTYCEQKEGIRKWPLFITWTRDNIQNGQNATATLYEQLNSAKQLSNRSPVQFNAYLLAIERDLL